jgi:hypothetical protein
LAGGLCALAALAASAPAQATTVVFPYTGGEGMFVVPAGVTSIQVVAIGGSGGAAEAGGGAAAQVTGNLSVTPGQILYVEVGGKGQSQGEGGAGGFNGGGSGAGGGGGASDVRISPRSAGLSPDPRLIVAGGGGGAGSSGPSGAGGTGGAAGEAGGSSESYPGGGAGTQTEGGAGAFGCEISGTGGTGERGVGGAGGDSGIETGPGGGGGGGLFGGGGGGGACFVGSSGGGGGSSLVPPGGSAVLSSISAAPVVEISYTAVASSPTTNPVPNTTITSHPKPKIVTTKKRVKVKFGFSSNVAGATFKCKLDKGSFAPCTSPKAYKVKPGKHKFSVEAIGAGGTDPTPASFRFKVVKKAA